MKFVRQIANKEKGKRRNAILTILHENKIPYNMYKIMQNEHLTENIVVSVNPEKRRYVIGAHYDNVKDSIGAVDNASGVSILIKLLLNLHSNTEKPIDFVFFDREEYEDRGSEAYLNAIGKDNIIAMLNLDPCGYGEVIAVHKMYKGSAAWFDIIFDEKLFKQFPVEKVNFTPNGDHMTFYGNGVPTVEICTMSRKLLNCFNELADYQCTDNKPPQELVDKVINSYDFTTFHNGENDKIETVSQNIMDKLLNYLLAALSD